MMTWRHPVGVSQILWIWTTLDGSILGAAHPGSRDPGVSLSSTLQLSYYSVRARALQRALCAHVSQHDSTGVLHPSGMSHRIPTPDHTIPLHGLEGLTQLLNTTPRIVALQGPSRGTLAATSSLCVGISHLLRRLSGTWSQETSSIRHPRPSGSATLRISRVPGSQYELLEAGCACAGLAALLCSTARPSW